MEATGGTPKGPLEVFLKSLSYRCICWCCCQYARLGINPQICPTDRLPPDYARLDIDPLLPAVPTVSPRILSSIELCSEAIGLTCKAHLEPGMFKP